MRNGWQLKRMFAPKARLAGVLALLGGCVYAIQSFIYAFRLTSLLDEGAYLYKGYLFVSGLYRPFQDFGPWTNKAPLAFLIPGFFQDLFGQGLRSARFVAVGISLLALLGLWLTARRLGGSWWAAAVVWGMALNPFTIKLYSQAISQGLVGCMLIWMLALTLGEERRTWQVLLGTFLAAAIVLTRQNMILVLPFLILYIFWQHGKKMGCLSLLFGSGMFILVHVLYWPNIMYMWLFWLPAKMTPFLDYLRLTDKGLPGIVYVSTQINRLLASLQAFRYNFFVLAGLLLVFLLWPGMKEWKKNEHFRTSVFLAVLMVVLLGLHAWASLWKDYCNYCFSGYIGFFGMLSPLLLVVMAGSLQMKPGFFRQSAIVLVVMGLFVGIGYGSFEEFGYQLREVFMDIMNINLPRTKDFFNTWKFQPGTVTLEGFLENKFGIVIDYFRDIEIYRRILPAVAGFLAGLIFFLLVGMLFNVLKKKVHIKVHYAALVMVLFVLTGSLLAPSRVLGGGTYVYDCDQDSLAAYEKAGQQLADLIPAGSQVYWDVSSSAASLLLYMPEVQIHPQQINGIFGYYIGGNTLDLLRVGQWNDQAAAQWLEQADIIVVEKPAIETGWQKVVSSGFEHVTVANPVAACNGEAVLNIYRKVP